MKMLIVLLLMLVERCVGQILLHSDFDLSEWGHQYQPASFVETLNNSSMLSLIDCGQTCNTNRQCRTFDYDSVSLVCRLFEGTVNPGSVIPSVSMSRVGSIRFLSTFFAAFGQSCSYCISNRYLMCSNDTCQCPLHSFWNGDQCENQRYAGMPCNNSNWCRDDVLQLNCSVANTCANTTNPPPIIIWSLDGNLNDKFGIYNGVPANGSMVWISPGYAGHGSAAYMAGGRYSIVPYPLDLTSTSFTLSTWLMFPQNGSFPSLHLPLFGQCAVPIVDNCLHLTVRSTQMYLGFFGDDLSGLTSLTTNVWYHVAFVFNRTARIQSVYLNGVQDGNRTSNIFTGTSDQLLVGAAILGSGLITFDGYIDEMIFVSCVKTTAEILDEATLVAYYSFDYSFADSGPNKLVNNIGMNVTFDPNGRVNQALLINGTDSYFQAFAFYFLGQSNYSYSISLWIYPFSTTGAILQVSSIVAWCLPFIGFDNASHLVVQTSGNGGVYYVSMTSSILSLNAWTHVGTTYSITNGLCLYVNGTLVGTNGSSRDYSASGALNKIIVGTCLNATTCAVGATQIVPAQFRGKIDEMRIYSRELSSSEISALANP